MGRIAVCVWGGEVGEGGLPDGVVAPARAAGGVAVEFGGGDVDEAGRADEPAGEEDGGHCRVPRVEPGREELQEPPEASAGLMEHEMRAAR